VFKSFASKDLVMIELFLSQTNSEECQPSPDQPVTYAPVAGIKRYIYVQPKEHSVSASHSALWHITVKQYRLRNWAICSLLSGDRNPVRKRFSAPVQMGPGTHPAPCIIGNGSFPRVKRPGSGVDHPSPIKPRLKKEYNYTSTSPLGLHGLF
jgi:hypothetical protein